MRTLIINNLPSIISEKDLFLLLNKLTPNLRRIIIADDTEICGKTLNLAVAIYTNYEAAKDAFEILTLNNKIMQNTIQVAWKEPAYDIISELAMETKTIYIKNMSFSTSFERLKTLLSKYGTIVKIKKFADKAFVQYDSIKSAKKASEALQDKRIDGMLWRIYPAKSYDEEKAKENSDKNIMFSKNFLEEADQHVLLRFSYDGTLPEIGTNYMQAAGNIVEYAKKYQKTTLENLKMQYDNHKNMQSFGVPNDDDTPAKGPIDKKKKIKKEKGPGAGGRDASQGFTPNKAFTGNSINNQNNGGANMMNNFGNDQSGNNFNQGIINPGVSGSNFNQMQNNQLPHSMTNNMNMRNNMIGGAQMNNIPMNMNNGVVNNGPMNNGPMNNGPMNNGPMNNGPMNNGPMNNGPMNNGPMNNGPMNNGPMNNGPINNVAMNNVPMNNIPNNNSFYLPNQNQNFPPKFN